MGRIKISGISDEHKEIYRYKRKTILIKGYYQFTTAMI